MMMPPPPSEPPLAPGPSSAMAGPLPSAAGPFSPVVGPYSGVAGPLPPVAGPSSASYPRIVHKLPLLLPDAPTATLSAGRARLSELAGDLSSANDTRLVCADGTVLCSRTALFLWSKVARGFLAGRGELCYLEPTVILLPDFRARTAENVLALTSGSEVRLGKAEMDAATALLLALGFSGELKAARPPPVQGQPDQAQVRQQHPTQEVFPQIKIEVDEGGEVNMHGAAAGPSGVNLPVKRLAEQNAFDPHTYATKKAKKVVPATTSSSSSTGSTTRILNVTPFSKTPPQQKKVLVINRAASSLQGQAGGVPQSSTSKAAASGAAADDFVFMSGLDLVPPDEDDGEMDPLAADNDDDLFEEEEHEFPPTPNT